MKDNSKNIIEKIALNMFNLENKREDRIRYCAKKCDYVSENVCPKFEDCPFLIIYDLFK